MEKSNIKENLAVTGFSVESDIHIPSVLTCIEMERVKNERVWESFMDNIENEILKFNLLLETNGLKVSATWDQDDAMECMEFHFQMIDESKEYSYCFMDVRNYGNDYFQFNRTSVGASEELLTEAMIEKFYSQKTKALYEGIARFQS